MIQTKIWVWQMWTKWIIFECFRQLGDIKRYLKTSEEEVKQVITEIQNKLKGLWKAICIKAIVQKRRLNF